MHPRMSPQLAIPAPRLRWECPRGQRAGAAAIGEAPPRPPHPVKPPPDASQTRVPTHLVLLAETGDVHTLLPDRAHLWGGSAGRCLRPGVTEPLPPPRAAAGVPGELTICTHSTRGRRTAWFPLSDTTQAGVSGVAWRRATTASTPMRLACK